MKLTRTFKLVIAGDTAAENNLFECSNDRVETVATFLEEESSGLIKVAPEEVAALPMGGVTTASALLVACDGNFSVRINGGTEDIAVKKPLTGRAVFYLEGAITAVEVENTGTATATVLYALAGV